MKTYSTFRLLLLAIVLLTTSALSLNAQTVIDLATGNSGNGYTCVSTESDVAVMITASGDFQFINAPSNYGKVNITTNIPDVSLSFAASVTTQVNILIDGGNTLYSNLSNFYHNITLNKGSLTLGNNAETNMLTMYGGTLTINPETNSSLVIEQLTATAGAIKFNANKDYQRDYIKNLIIQGDVNITGKNRFDEKYFYGGNLASTTTITSGNVTMNKVNLKTLNISVPLKWDELNN